MRVYFSFFVLVTFCLSCFAGDTTPLKKPVAPDDLAGIWIAHGIERSDGDDKPYAAVVLIVKHNDGYVAQWSVGPGANTFGLITRDDDVITASWTSGGRQGMTIYKLNGKEMHGKWISFPSLKWNSESLKWLGPMPEKKKVEMTKNTERG